MADSTPIHRAIDLSIQPNPLTRSGAAFLWGARQTGKSTLLRDRFPHAFWFDLLDTQLAAELSVHPHLFRERILAARPELVIVDEIPKVPALIDHVHWLLEHSPTQFILSGSSARKLRRVSHGLLGGRAIDLQLFPLTTAEVPQLDLRKMLQFGGLPSHYLIPDPRLNLRAYINSYVKQEIIDEAATRNIPAFTRFLHVLGLTNGQLVNYTNVARETGVSASTVRNYYQLVEDTLLGFSLEPWRRRARRQLVETAKFYLFDIGVANALHPDGIEVGEGTDRAGHAFEQFILQEIRAYASYSRRELPVTFWRTHGGFEVDFIIGDMALAVECKVTADVRLDDLRGLRALGEEHNSARRILVSRTSQPRRTPDGVEVVPWQWFCKELWSGALA